MFPDDGDGWDELEIDFEENDGKANNHQHEVQDEIDKNVLDDDENAEEKDEIEYETKDAVKKFHFEYNKSLCMSSKYPEMSTNGNMDINVAPGEGKRHIG